MTTQELETRLKSLGFFYLATHLSDFCAQATKKKLSPYQLVEQLAHLEQQEHLSRNVQRRLNAATLGRYRPLSDFDWAWPKKISRDVIDTLVTMSFVEEPANVIIFGPSGVGKTMIAKMVRQTINSSPTITLVPHPQARRASKGREFKAAPPLFSFFAYLW